jgi:hypothetical protein
MQPLKIFLTLLLLIILGIVVGSNLLPTMTVTILNQPTIALPIGIWLAIAIGLGLLSSCTIQLLLFVERRQLNRKIRQLKLRLQQDDDIFTYTPSATAPSPTPDRASEYKDDPREPKKSLFSSFRIPFKESKFPNDRADRKPYSSPNIDDDSDDWETETSNDRQLDWDEVRSTPRQQPRTSTSDNFAIPDRQRYSSPFPQTVNREEVYDADFRLIQPPYKEPLEDELDYPESPEEYLEDDRFDREEAANFSPSSGEFRSPNRDRRGTEREDEEDWGFDFDEEDTRTQTSRQQDRKR